MNHHSHGPHTAGPTLLAERFAVGHATLTAEADVPHGALGAWVGA